MATAREIYRTRPSQVEIDDVLGQRLTAALGTLNEDGTIHLAYMIFVFEDGRFILETSSETRKARNVADRRTASVLVQGTASNGRSLMVAAEGDARLIEPSEAQAVNLRIREKYLVADAVAAVHRAWANIDDVAIELTPRRWRSWTGSLLAATTAAAIGRDYGGIWKPD